MKRKSTHSPDDFLFVLGAGGQNDPIGLKALLLAARQLALGIAVLIDQYPAQAVSGCAALAKTEFDQAALARENLHRELAAVFTSHDPLDGLQQVRADAAIILELLAAVMYADPGARADMLMVGAFVGILKSAPAADVVDEDRLEVSLAGRDFRYQVLQCLASI